VAKIQADADAEAERDVLAERTAVVHTYEETLYAARGMASWRLRVKARRLAEHRDELTSCGLAALRAMCDALDDRGQPVPRGQRR
jgi:hypothetical protein